MLWRTGIKTFLMVSSKKNFCKYFKFLNFFAGPGSWNFSKITRSLYSKCEPKTHQNYPKCCSECLLRLFWSMWVKKFFRNNFKFLNFFAGPGSWNFSKMTKFLYPKYEPKTHLMVSISSKNFKFFELLQVRDHEIFQKWLSTYNKVKGSLKLTETTQNVVWNLNYDFLGWFE